MGRRLRHGSEIEADGAGHVVAGRADAYGVAKVRQGARGNRCLGSVVVRGWRFFRVAVLPG
ncbi:hypothetical protein Vgi01_07160 [Micromonospora gifhornensis]|uniref:Transposase n=1 Tax=Micromonospora gifhornensis TaxID=84594 RepID=A0ABQ4I811_9ACTN|nr:hypothetical protein Vgi01_07160 [Micromonospora gifhornensis]